MSPKGLAGDGHQVTAAPVSTVMTASTARTEKIATATHSPVEVRVTRGDDIPLSTASGRDSAYLAVHMYRGTPRYEQFFRGVDAELSAMDGRPHWGKLHYRAAADLQPVYPRWAEFQAARDAVDPQRVFTIAYVRRVLGS